MSNTMFKSIVSVDDGFFGQDCNDTPSSDQIRWPAPWLQSCIDALQELKNLPENWDSYGGSEIDPRSIYSAVVRVQQLARITKQEPSIEASPSGNAILSWEWESDNRSLEIEFLPNGRMEFAYVQIDDASRDVEMTVGGLGSVLHYLPDA